jgi:predicted RNA-binding Zn ribbon-like protein
LKFQIIAGELCLDFINTLDNRLVPEKRQELVPSYADLLEWAMQAGALSASQQRTLERQALAHPGKAESVHERALTLRECLYRIATAIANHRRVAASDLGVLNTFLDEALAHLKLQPAVHGFRMDWAQSDLPLDFVLWPIARSASDLLTGDDLQYVRECGAGTCRWLFVDRSKNHSRRWCDMKICGNRIKARKFYRRQGGVQKTRSR